MTREIIRFGFLPLTDAAIPIVAHEMGFAAEEGVALELSRETSWANIRDRMAVGHFDAAHLLAPMPIAAALQLLPMSSSIIVPMALGLGGNAVTVSSILWTEMKAHGATSLSAAREMGTALRQVLAATGACWVAEAGVWNCACLLRAQLRSLLLVSRVRH